MKLNNAILFLAILFLTLSCTKEGDYIADRKDFASQEINTSNVSYKNYIKPLLTKNCGTCHGDNGSAEFWWKNEHTYENAVQYAKQITTTINNGTMPPPPKFPFSERDRNLVMAWIQNGCPE